MKKKNFNLYLGNYLRTTSRHITKSLIFERTSLAIDCWGDAVYVNFQDGSWCALFFSSSGVSILVAEFDMASFHHFSKLYQFCCQLWILFFLCCIFFLISCILFPDGVDLGEFGDHHFIHRHFLLELQDFILIGVQFLILDNQLLQKRLLCVLLSLQSVGQLLDEQVLLSLDFEVFLQL